MNKRFTHFIKNGITAILYIGILVVPMAGITPSKAFASCCGSPYVVTQSASGVIYNSATLNGFVDNNGYDTTTWFRYSTNSDMYSASTTNTSNSYGSNSRNFSATVYNLNPNTTYYFQAVGQNTYGTIYGSTYSFATPSNYNNNYYNTYSQPQTNNSASLTAMTTGATDVTKSGAQLTALILNNSNNKANAWFEWGTTTNLGYITPAVSVDALPSVKHIHTISNLQPNTTYYFRAVVENSYWRNNGSILSFTTDGSGSAAVADQSSNSNYVYTTQPTTTVESSTTTTTTAQPATTTAATTKAPVATTAKSASSTSTIGSLLGANAIGANSSFLPQTLYGWLFLIILVLLAIHLLKIILMPKNPSPASHGHDSHDAHH